MPRTLYNVYMRQTFILHERMYTRDRTLRNVASKCVTDRDRTALKCSQVADFNTYLEGSIHFIQVLQFL